MTAHLDKNGRNVRPGDRVKVEGTVDRVDGNGVFIRISPGLVTYVSLVAVEVKDA